MQIINRTSKPQRAQTCSLQSQNKKTTLSKCNFIPSTGNSVSFPLILSAQYFYVAFDMLDQQSQYMAS